MKDPANKVISLDNYSTGSKETHIPGATYIEGDTNDIEKLVTVKPDLLYHLREYARVEKSFEQKNYCIRGERTKKKYSLGDRITFKVAASNIEQKTLDYRLL